MINIGIKRNLGWILFASILKISASSACDLDKTVAKLRKIQKVTVTSGDRTPEHNKRIGGAKNSHHLVKCGARDIVPENFKITVDYLLYEGYRVIEYPRHIHFDKGKPGYLRGKY